MYADRLFRPSSSGPTVPEGLPLVAGLTGFADAGGAVSQVNQYVADTLEWQEVGRFDNDSLLDYRARRPIFQFEETHLTDYQPAKLALGLVKDELGEPFLMLSGYEPDMRWEQVTREVVELIEHYKVSSTTWVHAIPMPVPHTRTLGVTVSGNRQELTDRLSGVETHHRGARNNDALSRVDPSAKRPPGGGFCGAGAALSGRHRISGGRGDGTREHHCCHGKDFPHRFASRAGQGLPRGDF